MAQTVPNQFPSRPDFRRIAIVGEAPGEDEVRTRRPFTGSSGRLLNSLLSAHGVSRESVFVGNVCQFHPAHNNIRLFAWDSPEIQHGLSELRNDISAYDPNIVMLLGNTPLKAAMEPTTPWTAKSPKVSDWRGSIFMVTHEKSPFAGRQVIATYHPAYALRDYEAVPFIDFDIAKAEKNSHQRVFTPPQRNLVTSLTCNDLIQRIQHILDNPCLIAIDIEGNVDRMSCISVATSPHDAFIIPFIRKDGSCPWSDTDAVRIWRALAALLEDARVPKVLQNSLYDRFVLHYSYGIRVRNVAHDTMLLHWELYAELEKALGVQTSLYTNECYYKQDRNSQDDDTFYQYCCRDSAVTLEIAGVLGRILESGQLAHASFNTTLLNPLLYMQLTGIRYDIATASERHASIKRAMYAEQARLNGLTGRGIDFASHSSYCSLIAKRCLTVKGDRPYKALKGQWERFKAILAEIPDGLATIGELETLAGVGLNINSPKQICAYLYDELKLPEQLTSPRRGEEPHRTADYEALLKLSRWAIQEEQPQIHALIQCLITLASLTTREEGLRKQTDYDGRMRCGYNIVGSNTGRVQTYESPTGNGYPLQTVANYTNEDTAPGRVLGDRDLFIADEGYRFFQCDLKGADGWTVAAFSAMLGDDTMLRDYRAGISPFEILTLLLLGIPTSDNRDELRQTCRQYVKKDSWERFAMKRVQHGGSYLEGAVTISRNVLKDSEGKLYIPPQECQRFLSFFFQRYRGVREYHQWVGGQIRDLPVLVAASGQRRIFFGRPDDLLTKAVAFMPQANTTYAVNLALYNLWQDPENYDDNHNPIIRPLHQVHDALCGEFPTERTEWAITKIRGYFNNKLRIAGQDIVIPYDGAYGDSWGNLNDGRI